MADPYPFLFLPDFGSGSEPDPPALPSFDLFRRRPLSPPAEPPGFLTLGFGFPDQEEEDVGRDWTGDEFFIGRRSPGPDDPPSDFSRARLVDEDGLRVLGLDSSSSDDDDKQIVAVGSDPEEPVLPVYWDCLRMDDEDDDDNRREIEIGDDFGWERVDERESANSFAAIQEEGAEEERMTEAAWEVLLAMRQFWDHHSEDYADSYLVEEHDYDDVLFVLLQEQEASLKGGPPAARSVVEGLPTVDLNKEEIGVDCAVCKDEFSAEEKAKRLPCRHYYHEECILPWLGMRNTCPLCRYELPTDDADYESRKARRAGSGGLEAEG
ncbi:E3 ubiquitin-protein ligase CIP8-like [Iris pallida]|uniref:RING-type E3 ubiquitin transferase n=1 Tax=Iris pallida TaxID=29817 RepID=A0AAX6FP89_IRIPA|nr:E3 ubiquitin-protein ligase CIP8-like [Iris pallida]